MKAEVRAALISLVLLSQAIAAIPNPPSLKDSYLNDPRATAELDAWVAGFGMVGIETNRTQVHGWGKVWTQRLKDTRKALIWPFKPVFELTGTGQGWGLFAFPDTQPYRFEVAVIEDGVLRDVFIDVDPEHDFMADTFAYRRIRAVYNPGNKPPPAYGPFTKWLAAQTLDAYPDADSVRIGFRRSKRLIPGQPHPGYVDAMRFSRKVSREAKR